MGIDYAALATTASGLLGDNGKASVYIRSKPVSYSDPVAGTVQHEAHTDTLVSAVEVNYNEAYQPGALIKASDRMYVLDTLPDVDDYLIIDDEHWEIVQVWIKKPGDTFIAAFAQVRQ